jgi:hypothetical protein
LFRFRPSFLSFFDPLIPLISSFFPLTFPDAPRVVPTFHDSFFDLLLLHSIFFHVLRTGGSRDFINLRHSPLTFSVIVNKQSTFEAGMSQMAFVARSAHRPKMNTGHISAPK